MWEMETGTSVSRYRRFVPSRESHVAPCPRIRGLLGSWDPEFHAYFKKQQVCMVYGIWYMVYSLPQLPTATRHKPTTTTTTIPTTSPQDAAFGLQKIWRMRVWSAEYYQRHYEHCIATWETELRVHHWDFEIRSKLTYFKKHKWRGLFLFEDQMAAKIQKWARNKRRKYVGRRPYYSN